MTEERKQHPSDKRPSEITREIREIQLALSKIGFKLAEHVADVKQQHILGEPISLFMVADAAINTAKKIRNDSYRIYEWLVDNDKPDIMGMFFKLTRQYNSIIILLDQLEKLGAFDHLNDKNQAYINLLTQAELCIGGAIEANYSQYIPEWNELHSPAASETTGKDEGDDKPAAPDYTHITLDGCTFTLPKVPIGTKRVYECMERAYQIGYIRIEDKQLRSNLNPTKLSFFIGYICGDIFNWALWQELFGITSRLQNLYKNLDGTIVLLANGQEHDGAQYKWAKKLVDEFYDLISKKNYPYASKSGKG